MAYFTTLYSGSTGNCGLILDGEHYLLVDMGRNCKTTLTALKSLDLPVQNCQGILVTHEHSDHVAGLSVFLKHHNVPVYSSAETLDALEQKQILQPRTEAIAMEHRQEDIGGFGVYAFPTSHDVACCGYRIQTPQGKVMSIATDLGVLTPTVHENLAGADLVAIESNYDLHQLRTGAYPYYLKKRIESTRGHLSNDDCANKVLELVQGGCKKIALCHLSRENNTPDLAMGTVRGAFLAAGCIPERDTVVQAQRRMEVSPLLEF